MRGFRITIAVASLILAGAARAEEAPPAKPWTNKTELSYVLTMGNSESSSLGFKNDFETKWDKNTVIVKAGGIRVESTTFDRYALSEPTPVIIEAESTALTAESYFLNGRYERTVTDRFFWYVGAGWDRNRFAGIDNRYLAEAGAGNAWLDSDTMKWKTYYAATYTDREDVVPDPDREDSFAGARVGSDFLWKFTPSAEYQNVTVLDYNFSDSSDWRGDMINSLAVSISKSLALKASLQWLYANKPALQSIPLYLDDPGGAQIGTVLFELDELDTIFTTSLVINF